MNQAGFINPGVDINEDLMGLTMGLKYVWESIDSGDIFMGCIEI